jgi:hypothetical protein
MIAGLIGTSLWAGPGGSPYAAVGEFEAQLPVDGLQHPLKGAPRCSGVRTMAPAAARHPRPW